MKMLKIFAQGMTMVCTLSLMACVSSGGNREDQEDPGRKAAELNTQLGREYLNRGQYEIALEKLTKAVRADEDYAPAHTMLAVLYERIGEVDKAGTHFLEAVEADPENGDVNNNYGAFLCRNGRADKAARYFEQALEDPFYRTPAVAYTNAGSCAIERGEYDEAEQQLREALRYDAEFPDALLALAQVSFEQTNYLRARAFLQRFEERGSMTAESLILGYRVENAMNNPDGARNYHDELVQRFPGTPESREVQGNPDR